jgi:hypothetical protein
MAIDITLNVFSGRENPRWTLGDDQEREFMRRLEQINTPTLSKASGVTGRLGYRGFIVSRSSLSPRGGIRLLVHEGIVDSGQTEENRVAPNRDLEQWLLSTAGGVVPTPLRNYLTTELGVPRFDPATLFTNRSILVACPACQAADAPAYAPAPWNAPHVQPFNNCYNYANDQITNTFAQPGRAHGAGTNTKACPDVETAAAADALATTPNPSGVLTPGQGWYVALVIWPGFDYHWYRQDQNGCWSHKPGQTAARDTDNSGNRITDPQSCDRGPYTNFCGYMITKTGITIL